MLVILSESVLLKLKKIFALDTKEIFYNFRWKFNSKRRVTCLHILEELKCVSIIFFSETIEILYRPQNFEIK